MSSCFSELTVTSAHGSPGCIQPRRVVFSCVVEPRTDVAMMARKSVEVEIKGAIRSVHDAVCMMHIGCEVIGKKRRAWAEVLLRWPWRIRADIEPSC